MSQTLTRDTGKYVQRYVWTGSPKNYSQMEFLDGCMYELHRDADRKWYAHLGGEVVSSGFVRRMDLVEWVGQHHALRHPYTDVKGR